MSIEMPNTAPTPDEESESIRKKLGEMAEADTESDEEERPGDAGGLEVS